MSGTRAQRVRALPRVPYVYRTCTVRGAAACPQARTYGTYGTYFVPSYPAPGLTLTLPLTPTPTPTPNQVSREMDLDSKEAMKNQLP